MSVSCERVSSHDMLDECHDSVFWWLFLLLGWRSSEVARIALNRYAVVVVVWDHDRFASMNKVRFDLLLATK